MKRNNEGWILLLWLSLTVMHVELMHVKSSWTWFEAKKLCEQHNDSLPSPSTFRFQIEHSYWSSQYRRFSSWIKILGCYNDSSPNDTEILQMDFPSAGFCQEICGTRNSSIFGIKQTECKCFGKLSLEQFVPPDYCTTIQTTADIIFKDHGGANAYTLYESDFNVTKRDELYCVAVQCQIHHRRFYFKPLTNCGSLSYRAACENSVSVGDQNWTSSMELCKTETSSYLAGNVSLDDVGETCDRLNVTTTGPLWLGVAREIYLGYDLGLPVSEKERKSFLQCNKWLGKDKGGWEFADCKDTVTSVFCEEGFTSDPVTTTIQPGRTQSDKPTQTSDHNTQTPTAPHKPGTVQYVADTSEASEHTSEISTNFINFISTHFTVSEQGVNNSSDTLSIILPLVVSIIIIGGIVMAAVIYMRRKKGQENHNAKPLDSRGTENGYTDIDVDVKNKNYFVLEQQSKTNHNESPVNYTYDSNPYTDTAEGVYDHLRDKESRKRREDEGNLRDSNPYKDIAEGIYDHLKDKESGKINKGDGKVMDSNPYKETKGGVYDHLREKESGKFTEENNYDHTPATTGKEYCVQGGMGEHTADTDYDHAMSFYNYKQHNQVIEETDGGYAKTVNVS